MPSETFQTAFSMKGKYDSRSMASLKPFAQKRSADAVAARRRIQPHRAGYPWRGRNARQRPSACGHAGATPSERRAGCLYFRCARILWQTLYGQSERVDSASRNRAFGRGSHWTFAGMRQYMGFGDGQRRGCPYRRTRTPGCLCPCIRHQSERTRNRQEERGRFGCGGRVCTRFLVRHRYAV